MDGMIDPVEQFLSEVRAELVRARTKFPGDRIMTIALAEEFGELCKAVLDEPAANVRKEAVQTAVMAARVALDGDASVREWRTAKGLDPIGVQAQDTDGVAPSPAPDKRKPWELTSWTCALARVDNHGRHCPEDKCRDCPNAAGVTAPVRTWQHDETGRITQTAECPGPRWVEVPAGVDVPQGQEKDDGR